MENKDGSQALVGELDVAEILKLREEADNSLQSLREHLLTGFMQGGQQKLTETISELAVRVADLRQEIMKNEIVKKSQKKYALRYGALAISLVFYGLASKVPAAGVGSIAAFLAAISHLRGSEKESEEKEAVIISSPAYALLKAKELLYCR